MLLPAPLVDTRSFNRELSWLEFNDRVMSLALDESVPLLERVRFAAIAAGNMDEFFEVRVAALQDRVANGRLGPGHDGIPTPEVLAIVLDRANSFAERHDKLVLDVLLPELTSHGTAVVHWNATTDTERAEASTLYHRFVHPVLIPLAVDPAHPFPTISNRSLNIGVLINDGSGERFARVKVPDVLPRFVHLASSGRYIFLEHLVGAHLDWLFGNVSITGYAMFRVTRKSDLEVDGDEADDLLEAVENELRRRRFGKAVRVEFSEGANVHITELLLRELDLMPSNIAMHRGPLGLSALHQLANTGNGEMNFPRRVPIVPTWVPSVSGRSFFEVLREADRFVHHPYEAFDATVVEFVRAAAADSRTQVIKMALYRTSRDGAVIDALIDAARAGVQVVALVELFARFDEGANVVWARRLEDAGVHVVYGVIGLKTHAKCILVVRRERTGMRRYSHIGTGNYNATTAVIYEDVGLFTADPDIGRDLGELFNHLTGYSVVDSYRSLVVAPEFLRNDVLRLVANEASFGSMGRIVIKVNSLVDEVLIQSLYQASKCGASIDLIVRGACCLRPGIAGLSENIRVRSILGRYLEHSRILYFANGDGAGQQTMLIGSADLMERNLDRRVEVLTPIRAEHTQRRISAILQACLRDDRFVWSLGSDGDWQATGTKAGRSVHDRLWDVHDPPKQAARPDLGRQS